MQMGVAVKAFPFLRAQRHRKYGNANWRCIAALFEKVVVVGVLTFFGFGGHESVCWFPLKDKMKSHILRDTPELRQLKAPDPQSTIKQLKEARQGNGPPTRGTDGPLN